LRSSRRHPVITAHDPAPHCDFYKSTSFDLLILDIKLGEIDGISFFKMLSRRFTVPTLFISGNATLTRRRKR